MGNPLTLIKSIKSTLYDVLQSKILDKSHKGRTTIHMIQWFKSKFQGKIIKMTGYPDILSNALLLIQHTLYNYKLSCKQFIANIYC